MPTPRSAALAALTPLWLSFATSALAANTVTITSQSAGRTVFIENLAISMVGSSTLTGVQFTITPKQGSFTRPLSATYSAAYMISRGYWNGTSANLTIPVFGLYNNAANTVLLNFIFSDGTSTQQTVQVSTAAYTDPCGVLNNPLSFTQSRISTTELSFDFIMLKKSCSKDSPTILDTDGKIRWVATDNVGVFSNTLFHGAFYKSNGRSGLDRVEWDGTYTKLADYADINVTDTVHHNMDPGRNGIVLEVDTTTETEATNIEVDATGKVLQVWDLGAIIAAAMTAGGDDPSKFEAPVGTDWFHDNSTTYNPADNTLIVSSRENFVIAVDYDPPANGSQRKIHWIFGDISKHWHQFASLRKFALHTVSGTATDEPIGQHSVSINSKGDLSVFDDGYPSGYQVPAGRRRNYTAPRAYHLDLTARTATSTYYYNDMKNIYSPICGSVYEDLGAPGNRLLDYPVARGQNAAILVALNPSGTQVFNYQYPSEPGCGSGWNAQILHLENLQF